MTKRSFTVIASASIATATRVIAKEELKTFNKPRRELLVAAIAKLEEARLAVLAIDMFDDEAAKIECPRCKDAGCECRGDLR